MAVREKRCGCDCLNQTVAATGLVTPTGTPITARPCCSGWSDGTPCRYAVMFECFNDWPLWTGTACGRVPAGVTLNWDGSDYCGIPSPLGLTFPTMEVIRDCLGDTTGECLYSNRLYNNVKIGQIVTHMAPSYLTDHYDSGVSVNAFPPYSSTSSGVIYHEADFNRYVDNPDYGDTEADPTKPECGHYADGQNLWELSIGSNPAILEWTYDNVLSRMTRFGGNTISGGGNVSGVNRPRYVAETGWALWGRNTMHLQNPDDWPNLKRRVCVAPLDIGYVNNPCSSHSDQCVCCDIGGSGLPFSVVIGNCNRLAGSYSWDLIRQTGTPPYCGVSEPTAPCGWFWTSIGTAGSCPTGVTPEYGGQVGFLIYCDAAPPTSPYNIDLYCYRNDTSCWVSAGSATITSFQCLCDGPYFSFTLPAIDCCCDVPPDCTCTPPATLYMDITGCSCWEATAVALTYNSTTECWEHTSQINDCVLTATLCCIADEWTLTLSPLNAMCGDQLASAASGTCDPFTLNFTMALSSDCCSPSGGSITITVTE